MKGSQGDTPEAVRKDVGAAYWSVPPCSVAWPTLGVDGRQRQHGGFPKGRGRRARRPGNRCLRGARTGAIAGAGDIAGVSCCEYDGSAISFASALEPVPVWRFEKQRDARFSLSVNLRTKQGFTIGSEGSRRGRSKEADNIGFETLPVLTAAESPLRYDICCFPPASPIPALWVGKQKTAPRGHSKSLMSFRKSGAGEGIRTLDPNLGNVPVA
jgi:hypothetical protein